MRVPFSWIKEYVAWDGTVEELAEVLTMSGTEVEGIDWVGAPRDPENLSRFVVGKVLTKEKHPNADKLSLCTVEVGEANGGVRQIVCGAHNFEAGDTVAGLAQRRRARERPQAQEGQPARRRERRHDDERAGARLRGEEPRHRRAAGRVDRRRAAAGLPAGQRGGARARADLEPAGLLQHLRHRPRGRGGGPAGAGAAAHRRPGGVRRRSGGRGHRRRDRRPGPVPAVRRHRHPRRHHRRVAGVAQGAPHARRHAPHQQRRRRHQLRDARLGPAAARVRRRQDPRRQAHRPPRHGRREDRHPRRRASARWTTRCSSSPTSSARWSSPACSAAWTPRSTSTPPTSCSRRPTSPARASCAPRCTPASAARPATASRRASTPTWCPAASTSPTGCSPSSAAAPSRRAWSTPAACRPAPAPLRYRPGKADALLGYEVPAGEQSAILRRLECEVDEAGVPVGARTADDTDEWTVTPPTFRPDLIREVDLIEEVGRIAGYGMAPETLPRHTTAGGLTKPQQVRRAVRRALAGCGLDEAITYTLHRPRRRRSARAARGRRPPRPGQALQPDERRAVGDAHHAAARPARGRARQRRPAQRPAEPVRDRQGLPVGRAGPGAGARRRARRRAAARAGGDRHRALRPARGRELDRRRPRRPTSTRSRASWTPRWPPSACAASTRRSARPRRTSPSCIPARPRS